LTQFLLSNYFLIHGIFVAPKILQYKKMKIFNLLYYRIGEGRACWSLGNVNTSLGNQEIALEYAMRHLEISKEVSGRILEYMSRMDFFHFVIGFDFRYSLKNVSRKLLTAVIRYI
jgi:hypothetical protein